LKRRVEEFKQISKYCFFIYELDPYVERKQLKQFESFLKSHGYDLDNFLYLDRGSSCMSGLEIKTL